MTGAKCLCGGKCVFGGGEEGCCIYPFAKILASMMTLARALVTPPRVCRVKVGRQLARALIHFRNFVSHSSQSDTRHLLPWMTLGDDMM